MARWQQSSRLLSKNKSITLNVTEGEKYTIIDHLGRNLQQGQTTSSELSLDFINSDLYIVKINKYHFLLSFNKSQKSRSMRDFLIIRLSLKTTLESF